MKTVQWHLTSEAETRKLAQKFSLFMRPGMVLLLKGELGAGKSTFARALIEALASPDDRFDIPSPSFALIQTYDATRIPVAHVDLYRTKSESEVNELGLADLAATHVLIVEWPSATVENLSENRLGLEFSGTGAARDVEITAARQTEAILTRVEAIDNFLSSQGWAQAMRTFLDGDASSRRYERLRLGASKALLMDMPTKPDGPPVKDGKPYSAIAHLAEGLRSVVAVNDFLAERGYGAPKILGCDLENGLALIEDFGDEVYGRLRACNVAMGSLMNAAVELLAKMAGEDWPAAFEMRDRSLYKMPSYDREAQLIEVDLLTSWFFSHIDKEKPPEAQIQKFHELWAEVLKQAEAQKPVWVLRDFHSPNLIWRPEEQGIQKVGLIDTQDALLGHPAYDLVSLLQDARIDIPEEEEQRHLSYYLELRKNTAGFDQEKFQAVYAILGAQRATKILGIFARLAKRDGKLGYLKHIPRVSRYLNRNLRHPALAELRKWFETNLPQALEAEN